MGKTCRVGAGLQPKGIVGENEKALDHGLMFGLYPRINPKGMGPFC